jgi:dolichyldiphosphatase
MMFAGQLACEALNFGLKRWIKEERPKRMYGKGYGMPSSHAQFVAYFAVYLALFLIVRHKPPYGGVRRRNHTPLSIWERTAYSAFGVGMAVAVAWSRIYLNYHTEWQVLVGTVAGAVSAVAWFVLTSVIRGTGLLAWGMRLPPARYLRFRDLVVEEDLCQAGWEKWDDKMMEQQAQKSTEDEKKRR